MITPSFSLTATERVLPRLALDFTTAALDSRVTFTRSGNTATITDSNGVIVGINADLPRFDYDPVSLVCKGLLVEEARTNVLLNSLIDGTSLATQTVTVTAAARTLSFYGAGSVVLSGAASATVTGTGSYPTRTTYTFTPSAGSLTLTVSGTVQFAQLELGAFATSFIPTAASAVTRNADVATMTGTNFSDWFNASEGTFVVRSNPNNNSQANASDGIARGQFCVSDGTSANRTRVQYFGEAGINSSGSTVATLTFLGASNPLANPDTDRNICLSYKTNSFRIARNAVAGPTDTSGAVPSGQNTIVFGYATQGLNGNINGYIKEFLYYRQALTASELQAFSK